MRKHAQALWIAAVMALSGAALVAQENKPRPEQTAKKTQPAVVEGHADSWETKWGDKKTVLMKGNVRFTHEDTTLTSDEVLYNEEGKIAVSTGKVHITNPEANMVGEKGSAYFKKRLGVLEGAVVIHLKPKKSEKDVANTESVRGKLKEPTTITCDRVEYFYKDKLISATGGVVFKQTRRTASADKVVYDEKKELVTLTGNVKGTDEYGQTFSAPGTVLMSVKEGDEWMKAKDARASFKIDVEEDEAKPEERKE